MELDRSGDTMVDLAALAEEAGLRDIAKSSDVIADPINPADHLGLLGSVANRLIKGGLAGKGKLQSAAQSRVWLMKNKGYPIEYDDLCQSGFFGLVSAAEKHRGTSKFSSYAFTAIAISATRQSGTRSELPIRYPDNLFDGAAAYDVIADFISLEGAALPDVDGYVSGDEEKDNLMWELGAENIGQGDPLAIEDSSYIQEEGPDINLVAELLGSAPLSQRERDIVRMRFGFDEDMTLEQVAEVYGVTKERIRQIEAKAVTKLRLYARCRQLCLEDLL